MADIPVHQMVRMAGSTIWKEAGEMIGRHIQYLDFAIGAMGTLTEKFKGTIRWNLV